MKRIFLLLFMVNLIFSQSNFAIEKKFPPLSIEYNDLISVISDGMYLTSKYDTNYSNGKTSITIERKNEKQYIANINDLNQVIFYRAYDFNFVFTNRTGSIDRIELDFSDYERTLEIQGDNYLEIQTIANSIYDELIKNKTQLSGFPFRAIMGFIAFFVGIYLVFNIRFKWDNENKLKIESKFNIYFATVGNVILIIGLLCVVDIIKLEYVFPGFLLLNSKIGFFEKNAPLFTFIGLLIAIIAPFIFNRKNKSNGSNERKQNGQ